MSQTVSERTPRAAGRRPSGERGNVRGEATRKRILLAAERLFAEHGISAVPLRDIGIEAGQRNHAAVQYHFGDRDELVKALMELRGAESEAIRTDIVTGIVVGGQVPVVADVVGAFVRPLAIHITPDNHYLAFLSLLITEQGGYESLDGVHTGASVISLRALLTRLAPDVPADVLDERWLVTMTSAVHALARYQAAQLKHPQRAQLDVLIGDLIAYLSAGLLAPLVAGDPRIPDH
ncbi:TetR/AcrR family transcriptional regulator [Microbacterium sp. B2969]|uniref:TetR/AcrR family transcriptional regulator n=1 Tax=Microbacterium alkaliflavum TaxID=3248839 RepID=A0ABW7Q2Z2_9MICO